MFPAEIMIEILQYVDTPQLISFTTINKFYNELIKRTPWQHIVTINNNSHVKYVTVTYMFSHYKFNVYLTKMTARYLNKCKIIHLEHDINYEAIKYLDACTEITLNLGTIYTNAASEYLKTRKIINIYSHNPYIESLIFTVICTRDVMARKIIIHCGKNSDTYDCRCVHVDAINIYSASIKKINLFEYMATNYTAYVYQNKLTNRYYMRFTLK